MEQFFYPKTIRNITISVLDLFNGIQIQRRDKNDNLIRTVNVPITFAPQEKYQLLNTRLAAGYPENKYWLMLPRIGVSFDTISYDPTRVLSPNETRLWPNITLPNNMEFWESYQPTPYNFEFTLFVRTESLSDFSQILENILPYFNPCLTLRVKEFSFLNIERDLQVKMGNINTNFLDNEDEENRRFVDADLHLTVMGFMYRPIDSQKVIRSIQSQYIITQDNADDVFVSRYSTSGVEDISGAPEAHTYSFSGTLPDDEGYYFTSGSPLAE